MRFFSGSSKSDMKVEIQPVPNLEEELDELPELPKPRSSTVITQGVTLSGKLSGEGVVQVEGILEGEVKLQGSVSITSTGLVRGPIVADVVRIAGRVEGNVLARDHLRLEKTGQMLGDVSTASLVIEDGGCLDGRSTMLRAQDKDSAVSRSVGDLEFGPDYQIEKQEDVLV